MVRPIAEATRGYQPVDYLTQGYTAFVGLLVLLFHSSSLAHWRLYVALHGAILLAAHLLIRLGDRRRGRFLHMLRCFYPMILYTLFYTETHKLDNLFHVGNLDGFFIDLDQRIFGGQPSRTMMQALPYVWVSEAFYLSYFSYYVMVLSVGLALYVRDARRFFQYITVISVVFYACYVTFIFLPVMGPHGADLGYTLRGRLASIAPREVPAALRAGPFYRLMGVLYTMAEPESGAAFPSSHVAVAVATLWFTWSYLRSMRWLHTVAVIMLCVSTVYCGYHYAVDVFGGLAAAAVLVPVGFFIHRCWDAAEPLDERRDAAGPTGAGP